MPLLNKPCGDSEVILHGNDHTGTLGPVTCQICGTEHPERSFDDESYSIFTFMGSQGVMQCCGKIVDRTYREWGDEFFRQRLEEFVNDPLATKYCYERSAIKRAVARWKEAAEESQDEARAVEIPEERE